MADIEGVDREQQVLFPEVLDEYVTAENPVRFIDAFLASLDLAALGYRLLGLTAPICRLSCRLGSRGRFGESPRYLCAAVPDPAPGDCPGIATRRPRWTLPWHPPLGSPRVGVAKRWPGCPPPRQSAAARPRRSSTSEVGEPGVPGVSAAVPDCRVKTRPPARGHRACRIPKPRSQGRLNLDPSIPIPIPTSANPQSPIPPLTPPTADACTQSARRHQ
jgi:hypothetical protein